MYRVAHANDRSGTHLGKRDDLYVAIIEATDVAGLMVYQGALRRTLPCSQSLFQGFGGHCV
ncbi:uncharacterized protein PHALS_06755 [Plasmopara halstedii]|uniref:Uncharacterized protein n=1 Tax=Plasmopara halstedii TaxID=4781 RepID=A0A0P1B3X6_PLAHL|nr:uncharacterized protein PHALS_06755 [Plasmopara halstedii]CEG48965.1 hypothetical protein PHALS_06755 [Plasmopara halstedii]|eukprot:XP_024585334.1 hypothetical protein PHALS_06755 [Plasmopara halstedii]